MGEIKLNFETLSLSWKRKNGVKINQSMEAEEFELLNSKHVTKLTEKIVKGCAPGYRSYLKSGTHYAAFKYKNKIHYHHIGRLIYLVYFPERDLIKIGYTGSATHYNERMWSLKREFGQDMLLVGAINGPRSLENILHKHFQKYHVEREFFRPNQEIFDLCRKYNQTNPVKVWDGL